MVFTRYDTGPFLTDEIDFGFRLKIHFFTECLDNTEMDVIEYDRFYRDYGRALSIPLLEEKKDGYVHFCDIRLKDIPKGQMDESNPDSLEKILIKGLFKRFIENCSEVFLSDNIIASAFLLDHSCNYEEFLAFFEEKINLARRSVIGDQKAPWFSKILSPLLNPHLLSMRDLALLEKKFIEIVNLSNWPEEIEIKQFFSDFFPEEIESVLIPRTLLLAMAINKAFRDHIFPLGLKDEGEVYRIFMDKAKIEWSCRRGVYVKDEYGVKKIYACLMCNKFKIQKDLMPRFLNSLCAFALAGVKTLEK